MQTLNKITLIFLLVFTFSCHANELDFSKDRHLNLGSRYHCKFKTDNATFASCTEASPTFSHDISIYIINNNIEHYNFQDSHFRELKKIGLANVKRSFSADIFRDFYNLELLKVMGYPDNNRVEHLPNLSFLTKLKTFNLYNNNLGASWNSQLFKDLVAKTRMDCQQLLPTSLDYLDLVANGISYLPSWISNLVNLTYLNLDYNELTHIPYGMFRDMKSLRYLLLSMNQLVNVDNSLALPSLYRLDIKMQRNQMVGLRIEDFAFDVTNNAHRDDDEDHVIDLRTEPEKLNLQNRALCTIPGRFVGRRKLLILNARYNGCILKQFDGIVEMYDLNRGIFTLSSSQIEYSQCGPNSYSTECLEVLNCDYRYSCYHQAQRTTKAKTTTIGILTAEFNPFLDQIRARNSQRGRTSTTTTTTTTTTTIVTTESNLVEIAFDLNSTESNPATTFNTTVEPVASTTNPVSKKQVDTTKAKQQLNQVLVSSSGGSQIINRYSYLFHYSSYIFILSSYVLCFWLR